MRREIRGTLWKKLKFIHFARIGAPSVSHYRMGLIRTATVPKHHLSSTSNQETHENVKEKRQWLMSKNHQISKEAPRSALLQDLHCRLHDLLNVVEAAVNASFVIQWIPIRCENLQVLGCFGKLMTTPTHHSEEATPIPRHPRRCLAFFADLSTLKGL